jgi:MYXO-CTERM domain-containing protein
VDEWTNNVFRDNRAILGGGLAFLSNPLTDFRNNTLIGNVGTTDASSLHLYLSFGLFRNNLFSYAAEGRAVVAADSITAQEAIFWNNAFWQNADGDFGEVEVEEADGNLQVNPMLSGSTPTLAPEELGAVLVAGSPLIDAGDSQLKDPDGSDGDIGARGGPDFPEEDADEDGFSNQYDCNDQDAEIYPGAEERWYDGVNQDCGLGSDFDQDGDGAKTAAYGGPDCDDKDPDVIEGCDISDGEDEQGLGCACSSSPKSHPLALLGLLGLLLLRRRESRE